jgi:hypothetical protein
MQRKITRFRFHRQMRLTQRAVPTLSAARRVAPAVASREFLVHQRVRDAAEAVGALGEKTCGG